MSFIQRELDRISYALTHDPSRDKYPELYAAQQALAWAMDPEGFKAPYKMLVPEGEDCPVANLQPHPPK